MTDIAGDSDTGSDSANLLEHIPSILMQRKWFLIIPLLLSCVAGGAAWFLLPRLYESKAIMVVESPLLPQDVAKNVPDEVVDQRIARFKQQILSRAALIELMQKYALYTDERASSPLSKVVDTMRDHTIIAPLEAEVLQKTTGKTNTIAFSMTFSYPDPNKAQSVAQDLTERLLQLDATKNNEEAQNTVQFLTDQSTDLQKQIAEIQGQINHIKAQNGSVLANSNLSAVGMSGLSGGASGSIDTQIAMLQRDNAQLNTQRDLTKSAATRDPGVAAAEAQLAAARAVYSESHPDVVAAKERLEVARQIAAQNVQKIPVNAIDQQIAFNNAQIAKLQASAGQMQAEHAADAARVASTIAAQSKAPAIMEQVSQLDQKLDGLNTQYQSVSSKLMEAKAGAKAENELKGERLTLSDPPTVPEEPSWPKWPLLLGICAGAGLGLGLILVFAVELFTRPIRDIAAIRKLTGQAPLVAIPTIKAANEKKTSWFRKLWPFKRSKLAAT